MPKLSLWRGGIKSNDYYFFDRNIKGQFDIGGVGVLVHKYIGVIPQGDTGGDITQSGSINELVVPEVQIQDLLLLENRDRNYDPNVYELRGIYNVQDIEMDLRQFGIFLENDTLYINFTITDCVNALGRKLMSGDVIELPHLREDLFLDQRPAVNKFYQILDINYAAAGYSPTWFRHMIRAKISPIADQQEFRTILEQVPNDRFGNPEFESSQILKEIISTYPEDIRISDAVVAEAEKEVPFRNFEINQFYLDPEHPIEGRYNLWLYGASDIPPNGMQLVGKGTQFPQDPQNGEWFVRTDYEPYILWQYKVENNVGIWFRREVDFRKRWHQAHRLLESFINNRKQIAGLAVPERQPISKALRPKVDVDHPPIKVPTPNPPTPIT